MDDIINRLSRQPGQPEQYKKFNPNPQPEYPVQNIAQFPQYEEWKSMIEGGTLPPEFDMRPGEEMPTGLPTEIPGAMPTGEGIEGMPPGFSIEDIMRMITGGELSTAEINLMRDLGLTGLPGEGEPIGEGKPMIFPETREEFIDQKIQEGMKSSEIKGLSDLLYPEEAAPTPTPMDIMTMGKEQDFTTQDQYIGALMGEVGMDYNEALTFYQTFSGSHPDYPRDY